MLPKMVWTEETISENPRLLPSPGTCIFNIRWRKARRLDYLRTQKDKWSRRKRGGLPIATVCRGASYKELQGNMAARWTHEVEGGPRRVNHAAVTIRDRFVFSFGGYCTGDGYASIIKMDVHVYDTGRYRNFLFLVNGCMIPELGPACKLDEFQLTCMPFVSSSTLRKRIVGWDFTAWKAFLFSFWAETIGFTHEIGKTKARVVVYRTWPSYMQYANIAWTFLLVTCFVGGDSKGTDMLASLSICR